MTNFEHGTRIKFSKCLFSAFFWIITGDYYPDIQSKENRYRVITYIQEIFIENSAGVSYRPNEIEKWLLGYVDGKKGLSPSFFDYLLKKLIEHEVPWLKTQNDVEKFLKLGRPRYTKLLRKDYVLALDTGTLSIGWKIFCEDMNERFLSLLPNPFISRSNYLKQIEEKIKTGVKKPIVLYGMMGVGKTTILHKLHTSPIIKTRFPQFFGIDKNGEAIPSAILHSYPNLRASSQDSGAFFQDLLLQEKSLISFDNLENIRQLTHLSKSTHPKSLIIAATENHDLALDPGVEAIYIDGFTWDETLALAQAILPDIKNAEHNNLRRLSNLTWNNPAALGFALNLVKTQGWENTLKPLDQPIPVNPTGVENQLFKLFYWLFETLAPEYKVAFRTLGTFPHLKSYDLKFFAKLWEIPEQRAIGWIKEIERTKGLFIQHDEQIWSLRRRGYEYTQLLLDKENPEIVEKNHRSSLARLAEDPILGKRFKMYFRQIRESHTTFWHKVHTVGLGHFYKKEFFHDLRTFYKLLQPGQEVPFLEWLQFETIAAHLNSDQLVFAHIAWYREAKYIIRIRRLFWFLLLSLISQWLILLITGQSISQFIPTEIFYTLGGITIGLIILTFLGWRQRVYVRFKVWYDLWINALAKI